MIHGLADLVTQVTGKAEYYVFKCPFLLLTVQILFKLHLRLHELFCLQTCSYAILSMVSLPGTAHLRASPSNNHPEEQGQSTQLFGLLHIQKYYSS